MLGIFIGDKGVSIVEGEDFALAPEIAADPHNGVTMHKLVATDAVVFDPEQREQFGFDFAVCAFYEQIPATKWELAIRPEPTCQKSE